MNYSYFELLYAFILFYYSILSTGFYTSLKCYQWNKSNMQIASNKLILNFMISYLPIFTIPSLLIFLNITNVKIPFYHYKKLHKIVFKLNSNTILVIYSIISLVFNLIEYINIS